MNQKKRVEILFSEQQRRKMMQCIGISADGMDIEKESGKVSLINPRIVSSFRLSDEQRNAIKSALGKDVGGVLVDPVTFGVDMITADDVRIQMWGEYRD